MVSLGSEHLVSVSATSDAPNPIWLIVGGAVGFPAGYALRKTSDAGHMDRQYRQSSDRRFHRRLRLCRGRTEWGA